MKKQILTVIPCFLIILVLQILTPFWWWIMVIPFLFTLFLAKSGWDGLRLGVFSAGLLWLFVSLYYWLTSSQIIASRVAEMIGIGISWVMVVLTFLVAAIASGFAGMTGFYLQTIFRETRKPQRQ